MYFMYTLAVIILWLCIIYMHSYQYSYIHRLSQYYTSCGFVTTFNIECFVVCMKQFNKTTINYMLYTRACTVGQKIDVTHDDINTMSYHVCFFLEKIKDVIGWSCFHLF